MSVARSIMIVGATALLAVEALRVAAVTALPSQRLVDPARVWTSHPAVMIDQAMTLVGQSARMGKDIPDRARALLASAAARDPLAPMPFLVEGARAELAGRTGDARRLFEAAKARDPRSGAARYFLAGQFVAAGQTAEGLAEMSALARLVPGVEAQFTPTLVAFAKQSAAIPVLRHFFERSPTYRPQVLAGLAQDAANAELIAALAGPRAAAPSAEGWEATIVNKLIETGQPARAQLLWRRLSRAAPYQGVFNPTFAPLPAPGPFNWTYDSSGAGLISPGERGGLELVYYGRADADLASQTLLLAPGEYLLDSRVVGTAPGGTALSWRIACAPGTTALGQARLSGSTAFTVPAAGCPAQRLRLAGSLAEVEQPVTVNVQSVRIVRRGGQ